MRTILSCMILAAFVAATPASPKDGREFGQLLGSQKVETRCGWLVNPTPANAWLIDRDGQWTIGIQGGYQAKGDAWPIFDKHKWIVTNIGDYGYGCACFRLMVDKVSMRVLELKSAAARPLSACRKDKKLKEPV